MKGYIYTMYKGADPGKGWTLTDPIFGKKPTMGACMPNIRRLVMPGDYIFFISGRMLGVKQYVVGGFCVDQKIHALAAFQLLPENRQRLNKDGTLSGNIIVDKNGKQNEFDYHSKFEKRLDNYIIGKKPIVITKPNEIEIAREETVPTLQEIFKKKGNTVGEIIGRFRKLDERQIQDTIDWLAAIKKAS